MTAEERRLYDELVLIFSGQGFDETVADLLASADVDPSDAARLVRRGCPHELAYRILS